MIKVYIENISNTKIGGGFRFLENLNKGLKDKVTFVDDFKECDIFFIFGITAIDKGRVYEAHKLGKKIVLRADNIPRCSRNKRMHPAERLTEFGAMASAVVYQSEWCKKYAGYFIKNDNEVIINNGVDTEIFNDKDRHSDGKTYLYINYNDNPNKRFDEALYWFDMEWRQDNSRKLLIAGNVPRIYREHPEYNWDIPSNAKVEYAGIMDTPEQVAELMRGCDFLLYPAFCDAAPNTLLEGMACGLVPLYLNKEGGSVELMSNSITKIKSIQDMSNEYLELFKSIL